MPTSAKGKAKLLATELLFVIVYSIYTGSRSLSRLFSRLVNRVKPTRDVAATGVDLGLVRDVMDFNINHEERQNDVVVSLLCTLLHYYLMCEYSLVHLYQQLMMKEWEQVMKMVRLECYYI